jgi:signal transduction histidine kinase/DNA-binding response OmpR family regulator
MLPFGKITIARKLRVISLLSAIVALGLGSALHVGIDITWYRSSTAEHLTALATAIGGNAASALRSGDKVHARELMAPLEGQPDIIYASLRDVTGMELASFVQKDFRADEARASTARLAELAAVPNHRGADTVWTLKTLAVRTPVVADGEIVGNLYVHASNAGLYQRLGTYLGIATLVLLFAVAVAYLLAARLQRGITDPVGRLVAVVNHVSRDRDFGARCPPAGDDEIGYLIAGFNEMLERIQMRERDASAQNEMLEAKVNERTRRLAQANEQLRDTIAEAMEARAVAERASHAKSEFLARMSHEIRTPMNGVLGMTELLLGTLLNERQQKFGETIQQSAQALLSIIDDILDVSKIEAGKLRLDAVDFDLRAVVEDTVELLAERAERKGLELLCVGPPEPIRTVRGDPGRLRQILTNLIGNAVKFTEAGEVTVRFQVIAADAQSTELEFEVTDTGVGIRPENHARIFESFSQEDGSTTRRFGGTGLGLAISRHLVRLMGGEIGVVSEPGCGSTFRFNVRLAAGESSLAPAAAPALAGTRILILDHHAGMRQLLCGQLAYWGSTAREVGTTDDAFEALLGTARAGVPFDLAIIELSLAGGAGAELVRQIRAEPALATLRLLAMTSVTGSAAHAAAAAPGVDGQLRRPPRQAHLGDELQRILGVSRAAPLEQVSSGARETDDRPAPLGGRVLLVEDNAVNQAVALGMLGALGCTVTVAGDGREAVERVTREAFDVVLMDCQMPVMDGFEATAMIRRIGAGHPRTPIIALTANALQGDRERCLAAGMDDYLAKPFTMAQLAEAIGRWLPPDPQLRQSA